MAEMEERKLPEFTMNISHEAKLKELLRNLNSVESQLFSDASKEFIKILKSDLGPDFLRAYVKTSSKLVEILQAWESRKGKLGFLHILNLVAAILNLLRDNEVGDGGHGVSRWLDKFAQTLIEEKMRDLYKELNNKEAKRQNAVLLLLASIVRRNSHLAWEVSKVFDFKLAFFPKLAEVRLRVKKFVDGKRKSHSTRKAFVSFAMSFLEVGNPRLLRGILQQKEMYSGVLRGLGNDEEETVIYVLSVLRDKVLVPESLVPPGLRSVLFGNVTLEQLASISGRGEFGDAAELAHSVLIMVCTDPVNGLMPALNRHPSPLRGNPNRLLGLMKKLKATEVEYHKELLLAIVKERPSFGSAYLDEFPYSLEDIASDNWFPSITLAADVVSSVSDGLSFGFFGKPPASDSQEVQNILKCIGPRPFTRLVINKGLLHADSLVKHGTLKLVVEALKLLDSLVNALDTSSDSHNQMKYSYRALKADIQNSARMSLPDPQVFLSLLSPLSSQFKCLDSASKRKAEAETVSEHDVNIKKRLKSSTANKDLDIVISGVNSSELDFFGDSGVADLDGEQKLENGTDVVKIIGDMWGLQECSMMQIDTEDVDTYFHTKILDSLKIYYRTMPVAMEGVFDAFKFLPNNPLALPTILQQSLLQLLNEYVNQFSKDVSPIRTPPHMYRHLYPFIVLLMGSPLRQIKEQAYVLAKAAMLSTGAFDNNIKEICVWFLFIPGYSADYVHVEHLKVEIFQELSSVIISFLCDAVSTTGNNLYKYMELLKRHIYDTEGGKDLSSKVSPFTICVLEKCLRLLSSESGSFTVPQKSLISCYVSNTIKYLLDTQVNAGTLSFLIDRVLSEKLENFSSKVDALDLPECPCEWRPLKTLLRYVRDILRQQCYGIHSNVEDVKGLKNSFVNTLREIDGVLRSEYANGLVGLTVGFSFSLMCARHDELLQNFPLVLSMSSKLLGVPFSVLSSIFFLEPSYLSDVYKLWPEMFVAALHSVNHCKEKDESSKVDLDSEVASVAFSHYLKVAPFYVLFSCIAQSGSLHLFEQSTLQTLLFDKVTGITSDHLLSSLSNVLFWINHTRSCYKVRTLDELKMLSEICFKLAEHLLKQLLVENINSVSPAPVGVALPLHSAVDVAEIIFNSPAVIASLDCPLSGEKVLSDSVFGETLEELLEIAKQGIHRTDLHILNLLRVASELLLPMCNDKISEQVIGGEKRILQPFKYLEQKLFLIFKNKFDACIQSRDFKSLLPIFYALHSMICFISPFELLELVNWLFSQVDIDHATSLLPSKRDAFFVGLHLASCTFDILSAYMRQPPLESKLYSFRSETEAYFDVLLFERIFFQVLKIGRHLKLNIADACVLKAVKVVQMRKAIHHPHLPSVMVLQRVVATIPVNMFSYCLHRINRTKADLLNLIAGLSPLHMSVFGFMFSELLDKSSLLNTSGSLETCKYSLSDEELLMLLPTAILYLSRVISKVGGHLCKPSEAILSVYGRVLLGGFIKWKIFVSESIFGIGLDEPLTASKEEYLDLFSESLLGKAIIMVRDYLILGEATMKVEKRLNLFNSMYPSRADDIFEYGSDEAGIHSLKQPLDFVNRVVAKINFCRLLLVPDHNQSTNQLNNGDEKVVPPHVTPDMAKSRIRFLRLLINSWILIAKEFHENNDGKKLPLFRFLEVFVMDHILELTTEMHDCLTKMESLPFIEQLVKSFLLYRFGDPVTLKMLRTVLTHLSDGKFSCASVIQLLLAHSQFVQSIHLPCQSPASTMSGLALTPMQSILRSFRVSFMDPHTSDCKPLNFLELVKFVRVLFHIYAQQREVNSGEDCINSRELVYLLLSSYGATCSVVDLEIYNLLLEIESNDESCAGTIAQTDYLWGISSIKMRKDGEQDKGMQSVDQKNTEFFEDRKVKFRENIPIDPKLCAQTVLHFPYHRFVNGGNLHKLEKASSAVVHEAPSTTDKLQIYDPVFILRFSIHCLSMSYIEPIEFASLGLLGVTFASISSPDDDMRKLGYEVLARFKSALEKCQKKKDVVRLRLLLSYLQNGIDEPWQRIPSIIAVFAAEASLVLLDPSHDNYSSVSKYLSNSPSVNMKAIPLFPNLFWSTSISFKAERLWMLRLLYVGLNTEDDAQIYIRNSIFETLLSFYLSPLSDNDSKELIIQVVKKAVLLHKAVWFLVEHCGLILWLSSIVSYLCGSEFQDERKFALTQLPIILEVVNCITSPRNILEWLQRHAMEQLSELSLHLYKLIVSDVELIKNRSNMCTSILQILTLVLKISQKRRIYQPHFTLSEEGLFQLYEAVEVCSTTSCNLIMSLGLKAVLMSTPPVNILHMDQEKLSRFLSWAVTTAVQLKSEEVLNSEDSDHHLIAVQAKTPPEEDSIVSKLLRWLTASLILGKISCNPSKLNNGSISERQTLYTLLSCLRCPEKRFGENACEDMLAASIFYLIQLLNFSHTLLPSAVSALCLLLLSDSSEPEILVGHGTSLQSLCSTICCPAEANPAWRWSYYQPWRDLTIELSDAEKLDKIHACERLLMVSSNILLQRSRCCHFFELKDVDNLHVHEWERTITQSAHE